eukprot:403354713
MEEQTNFDKSSQQIDSGKPSEVKVPRTHSQFAALISNQIPVTQFDELITLESIQFYISKISDNPDSILFNKKPRVSDYSLVVEQNQLRLRDQVIKKCPMITLQNSTQKSTKQSKSQSRIAIRKFPTMVQSPIQEFQRRSFSQEVVEEDQDHQLLTGERLALDDYNSQTVNLHSLAAQHKANQKQVQSSTVFLNNLSNMNCQNMFNAHQESGVSVIQDDLAHSQKYQIMNLLKDFKKNEDMVNSKFLIKNDEQIRSFKQSWLEKKFNNSFKDQSFQSQEGFRKNYKGFKTYKSYIGPKKGYQFDKQSSNSFKFSNYNQYTAQQIPSQPYQQNFRFQQSQPFYVNKADQNLQQQKHSSIENPEQTSSQYLHSNTQDFKLNQFNSMQQTSFTAARQVNFLSANQTDSKHHRTITQNSFNANIQ